MENYYKVYLEEKSNRLRLEMSIMQDRFARAQRELQETENELKALMEVKKTEETK